MGPDLLAIVLAAADRLRAEVRARANSVKTAAIDVVRAALYIIRGVRSS